MNIIRLIAIILFYLNYRIAYFTAIHRHIMSFEEFINEHDYTEQIKALFFFDAVVIAWYFVGFWWMIAGFLALNLILFSYDKIRTAWKARRSRTIKE